MRTISRLLLGRQVRWTMPMPPSMAMAIAMRASVTVSMAALTKGMLTADARR